MSRKPTVALITQARTGSTRLPGKTMRDLAGAPLLHRIIDRVKRCKSLDAIVVATTTKARDDLLAQLAASSGVLVYRGSEDDLVDRHYHAAIAAKADVIVRFPSDNPCPEPSEIDRIVEYHLTRQSEFSSNLSQVFGNGYPDGIGAEVFDLSSLEYVWRTCDDPEKREHPHLNFFDYKSQRVADPGRFRVGTVQCPEEFRRPDLVLDVNTEEEYRFMADLYEYLYPQNPEFHITDVINWYDNIYLKTGKRIPRDDGVGRTIS